MQSVIREDGFEFGFNPSKCFECKGECCIGESGYIWCTPSEITNMANFIEIEIDEFISKYINKIGYKKSLKEIEFDNGYRCIFFDDSKRVCQIYQVRPKQCRTFPFWDSLNENIKEVAKECPGIII